MLSVSSTLGKQPTFSSRKTTLHYLSIKALNLARKRQFNMEREEKASFFRKPGILTGLRLFYSAGCSLREGTFYDSPKISEKTQRLMLEP
jgi:hypothetical protein